MGDNSIPSLWHEWIKPIYIYIYIYIYTHTHILIYPFTEVATNHCSENELNHMCAMECSTVHKISPSSILHLTSTGNSTGYAMECWLIATNFTFCHRRNLTWEKFDNHHHVMLIAQAIYLYWQLHLVGSLHWADENFCFSANTGVFICKSPQNII